MRRVSWLVGAVVLAVVGTAWLVIFAPAPVSQSQRNLNHTFWALRTPLGDEDLWLARTGREPGRTLRFQDGEYSGNAGCNGFSGDFSHDGASIQFDPVLMTIMGCLEPSDAPLIREGAYLRHIQSARSYAADDSTLSLFDENGDLLLTYSLLAVSTPTPTSSLDPSEILVQPSDIPPGYEPSDVYQGMAPDLGGRVEDVPLPDTPIRKSVYLSRIKAKGSTSNDPLEGWLIEGSIWVFEDAATAETAYQSYAASLYFADAQLGVDLGEQAMQKRQRGYLQGEPDAGVFVETVFVRCSALVIVTGISPVGEQSTLPEDYARRIDERVRQSTICR